MFKEELYPGIDLVDLGVLIAMVIFPLASYLYLAFAYRQLGVNGLLLTLAIPTFLLGTCGLLVEYEAPTLFKMFLPNLTTQIAESSQFIVAISTILSIPPIVNLIVDGVSPILPSLLLLFSLSLSPLYFLPAFSWLRYERVQQDVPNVFILVIFLFTERVEALQLLGIPPPCGWYCDRIKHKISTLYVCPIYYSSAEAS